MLRLYLITIPLLLCSCVEPGVNYSVPQTTSSVDTTDFKQGYPGEPIYDKRGKLVVFGGASVDRKTAENYVKEYNKTR